MMLGPLKLLTGGFAAVRDWANGGHRVIPRRPDDGVSSLTYGEVRRAAVAIHGPGTKVRIWHDGSGHILPPTPYREEEWLYRFEHEFQLRNLLPSLGTMTLEEWRPDYCSLMQAQDGLNNTIEMAKAPATFCSMPGCLATDRLVGYRVKGDIITLCPHCRDELP